MNANKVYDSDRDILNLDETEVKLLTQLCESPPFLFQELIRSYLMDTGKDTPIRKQRLQEILMFYRNRLGSRTFFLISREYADKLLEIIHKVKVIKPGQNQGQLSGEESEINSLEELFRICGSENANVFRREIVDKILTYGTQHDLLGDWKGKLKAVVLVLQERHIINMLPSATLANIFNAELTQLIQRSEDVSLQHQAFQPSKLKKVSKLIVDRIKKHVIAIDWVH